MATKPVALVTGASSGIGEVFARRLFARGFDLVLVARRRGRLERLASELGGAVVLAADLAADADMRRVEQYIVEQSNLEFLVNNAGFGSSGRFWEAGIDVQDRMHRLHIIAALRLTHAALEVMLPRARGSIINVSSVAAFLHNPFSVSYGATKAWINSFTEALYVELKSVGSPVRVQALCPGFTITEFHDVLGADRTLVPHSLWMTAESVVEASLRGLEKNRLFVIPGWRYRWFVRFQQRLPRSIRHARALKYGNLRSRP
jgi:short-subunit dehydrogenase